MGNYIPFRKTNTALKPQPSGYIPFGKSVQPIGETNLGLPEIGGVEITTPAIVSQKEKEKIGIKETLKYLTPQTISEAGGKVFGAIGQFGKTIGQSIARSFVSMGTELREQLLVPKAERKQFGEATYTPQNETEKKIFGTDKPINFKTIGEETLAIGGEDFKNKWGNYSIPVGMLIAGLDITPFGGGKKQVLEVAAKTISKTQDVVEIAKTLKTILRGSDEEIEILAKSLKMVNKEDEILKVIETAGKAKQATPIAQKATKLGVSAEKGIIPKELEPLAVEARTFESARLWKLSFEGMPVDKGNKITQQLIDAGFIEKPPTGMISKRVVPDYEGFYTQATKGIKEVGAERKFVEVPREQLPVRIEGAEKGVSALEARMKGIFETENVKRAKAEAEARGLDISIYDKMSKPEQLNAAAKYVAKTAQKEILEVLEGKREAPKGLLHNAIMLALEEKSLRDKNVDLSIKLASLRSTRAGQEISILTEVGEISPVSGMDVIIRARREVATKKLGEGKTIQGEKVARVKDIKTEQTKLQMKMSEVEKLLSNIVC